MVNIKKTRSNVRRLAVFEFLIFTISLAAFLLSAIPFGRESVIIINEWVITEVILVNAMEIRVLTIVRLTLVILSIMVMAVAICDEKLLHGGKDSNIVVKCRMFKIAMQRLEKVKENIGDNETRKEIEYNIYYELGVQAINETNDWAFEHIRKEADAPSVSVMRRG